jgi:hypothetical protein
MRKTAVTLAGAAAAVGLAAPAAAQFYPAYARGAYGYGYNTAAVVQGMDARVANVRAHIRDLQLHGAIRWNQARNLDRQAFNLQRSIHNSAWHGIGPGEAHSLDIRIANLERRVATAPYRGRYGPPYAGYRY